MSFKAVSSTHVAVVHAAWHEGDLFCENRTVFSAPLGSEAVTKARTLLKIDQGSKWRGYEVLFDNW